jgi:hypothetical protein
VPDDRLPEDPYDLDELADPDAPTPTPSSRPVDRFRRTATGGAIAAGLLGLRDALEGRPEREEVAIVNEAPQPRDEGPVRVELDFEHPERSVVYVRRPPEDLKDER